MSHIYDALRKSGEGDPERPDQGSEAGAAGRDGAAQSGSGAPAQGTGGGPVVPEDRLEGNLFGEPDIEFLQELDALRASVEVSLGRGGRRVVGFAAAAPDEGTTTVAAHYAYLMSKVAERSLSDAIGERDGFCEILERDLPLERVILATEEPNLHFLPAGRDRVHYVEAISSGAPRPLFERLGSLYDAVVVDIAPVLKYPEASLIASACDGVVLVVRAHRTQKGVVRRALAELNFAKCRVLGTVLNARRETLPGFLRDRV
jgi:Mrp family chromosome partitioning ATPase